MDTPIFTVHGKCTEEEFIRFYRYISFHSKNVRWIYGALFAVLAIATVVFIIRGSFSDCLVPVFCMALWAWILFGGMKRRAAKAFRSNKLSENLDYDLSLYDDHFDSVSFRGSSTTPYDKMNEIIETPTNFYLMTAPGVGVILRKQDMPEGAQEFLMGVKEKYKL
jgi:hypothetical protein